MLCSPEPLASVEDWRRAAEGLLSEQPCVFHRNGEISALYATLYQRNPGLFKWAGMAAFASHHVRVALFPLRIDADPSGRVDLPRTLQHWRGLHLPDVDLIRQTNNGIFDDVFWVHLAYGGEAAGVERVRRAVRGRSEYVEILDAVEQLDAGRRAIERGSSGSSDVWAANLKILRHEQRYLVQPRFERLTTSFARAFSLGASLSFRTERRFRPLHLHSTFYGHAIGRRLGRYVRALRLPDVTRFEDRWDWIESAIIPRYKDFERDHRDVDSRLDEIIERAGGRAQTACGIDRP
ncbi:MAG: hypothetical protein AAGI22_03805 [Planctomycetota bacterium]